MLDLGILENLLHQPEGQALDFKRDQYPFIGASDEDKSELLKDILALANSWRLTTAYILIGVQEIKGGRSEIVGVQNHLDDANLHQFVTSKTQRPVDFMYFQFPVEGMEIGVIQIPVQERPVYSTKNFGKLKANDVWIRDGSSSRIATSDEVAKMGAERALSGAPQYASERTNEQFIVLLEKTIVSIADLKNTGVHTTEFKEWHRATLGIIKSAFGDRSMHYWEFRDIVDDLHPMRLYGLLGWRIITGSWKGIFDQKLNDAAELLKSFASEIERYRNIVSAD